MVRCAPAAAAPALDFGFSFLLLYARVLRFLLRSECYTQGFFERCLAVAAICKGFKHLVTQLH